jgi:hypothetical protein
MRRIIEDEGIGICSHRDTFEYNATMPRRLVWIKNEAFQGFGCSECRWVFNPAGPLVGKSLDKMKLDYEADRDKEFATHVCASFPKPSIQRSSGPKFFIASPSHHSHGLSGYGTRPAQFAHDRFAAEIRQ